MQNNLLDLSDVAWATHYMFTLEYLWLFCLEWHYLWNLLCRSALWYWFPICASHGSMFGKNRKKDRYYRLNYVFIAEKSIVLNRKPISLSITENSRNLMIHITNELKIFLKIGTTFSLTIFTYFHNMTLYFCSFYYSQQSFLQLRYQFIQHMIGDFTFISFEQK